LNRGRVHLKKRIIPIVLAISMLISSCSHLMDNYVINMEAPEKEEFLQNIVAQKFGYLFNNIKRYKSIDVYLEKYEFGKKVENVVGPLKLKIEPQALNLKTDGEAKVWFGWSEPLVDGNPWVFNIEVKTTNGGDGEYCNITPNGQVEILTAEFSKVDIRDDMVLGCFFVSTKDNVDKAQFDFNKDIKDNLNSIKDYDEAYIIRCKFDKVENDFDMDGKNDIFNINPLASNNNGVATNISYSINFGNGDELQIGDFKDTFDADSLFGYDFNEDGIEEIVFCGKHPNWVFPKAGSEIAIYQKAKNGYQVLSLPRPDDLNDTDEFTVGYSVYKEYMEDNEVKISCPALNFEQIITIDNNEEALSYFKEKDNDSLLGNRAWKVEESDYNGVPAILMYINIGYKYFNKDLVVYLGWQNGELKPMKVELKEDDAR